MTIYKIECSIHSDLHKYNGALDKNNIHDLFTIADYRDAINWKVQILNEDQPNKISMQW